MYVLMAFCGGIKDCNSTFNTSPFSSLWAPTVALLGHAALYGLQLTIISMISVTCCTMWFRTQLVQLLVPQHTSTTLSLFN